jgi:hypothetical protein
MTWGNFVCPGSPRTDSQFCQLCTTVELCCGALGKFWAHRPSVNHALSPAGASSKHGQNGISSFLDSSQMTGNPEAIPRSARKCIFGNSPQANGSGGKLSQTVFSGAAMPSSVFRSSSCSANSQRRTQMAKESAPSHLLPTPANFSREIREFYQYCGKGVDFSIAPVRSKSVGC